MHLAWKADAYPSEPQIQIGKAVDEIILGLRKEQKTLPCKFFYDEEGSRLFDLICDLDEYYLTRTEAAILREYRNEILHVIGDGVTFVEFGSGSSRKTRILLDRARTLKRYVPIDISREHLEVSVRQLSTRYPDLDIRPLCADYTTDFDIAAVRSHNDRTVVFFPGSTIGNFEREEAVRFLKRIRTLCGPDGGLLIGVDLKKDRSILEAAYNDAKGITAAFNLNLLKHVNRQFRATFDPAAFAHRAVYNERLGRIEMYLVSLRPQTVFVAGEKIIFREGETIHTEISCKYDVQEWDDLAREAGFVVSNAWTDAQQWFGVFFLKSAGA